MIYVLINLQSTVNEESDAEKEDIYQLGVILLEVITGRQITSSSEVEQLKDEVSITTLIRLARFQRSHANNHKL